MTNNIASNSKKAAAVGKIKESVVTVPKIEIFWAVITPPIAQELLDHCNNCNRNVIDLNRASITQCMREGNFACTGSPIIIDAENNINDGQHRLQGIVNSGVTCIMLVIRGVPVMAHVATYNPRTQKVNLEPTEQIGIFTQDLIDQVSPRTWSMQEGIHQRRKAAPVETKRNQAREGTVKTLCRLASGRSRKPNIVQVSKVLELYKKELTKVEELRGPNPYSFLRQPFLTALMVFILKGSPEAAPLVKKFYQGKPDNKPIGKTAVRLEQGRHGKKLSTQSKELMVCQAFYNEGHDLNPTRALPGKEGLASFRRRQQATISQVQKIMGFVPDPEASEG